MRWSKDADSVAQRAKALAFTVGSETVNSLCVLYGILWQLEVFHDNHGKKILDVLAKAGVTWAAAAKQLRQGKEVIFWDPKQGIPNLPWTPAAVEINRAAAEYAANHDSQEVQPIHLLMHLVKVCAYPGILPREVWEAQCISLLAREFMRQKGVDFSALCNIVFPGPDMLVLQPEGPLESDLKDESDFELVSDDDSDLAEEFTPMAVKKPAGLVILDEIAIRVSRILSESSSDFKSISEELRLFLGLLGKIEMPEQEKRHVLITLTAIPYGSISDAIEAIQGESAKK